MHRWLYPSQETQSVPIPNPIILASYRSEMRPPGIQISNHMIIYITDAIPTQPSIMSISYTSLTSSLYTQIQTVIKV